MAEKNAKNSDTLGRPTLTARLVAAYLLDRDPYISDAALNRELGKLDLGRDRLTLKDGSHYRKLWRAKRLPPPPEDDPRLW